jgi:DNA transposition AAA+ family ATPase
MDRFRHFLNGFMPFVVHHRDEDEPNQEALILRLRQFVENSDLSFYKIASRVGISGAMLSMWLAGTARPDAEEMAQVEEFLEHDRSPERRPTNHLKEDPGSPD